MTQEEIIVEAAMQIQKLREAISDIENEIYITPVVGVEGVRHNRYPYCNDLMKMKLRDALMNMYQQELEKYESQLSSFSSHTWQPIETAPENVIVMRWNTIVKAAIPVIYKTSMIGTGWHGSNSVLPCFYTDDSMFTPHWMPAIEQPK